MFVMVLTGCGQVKHLTMIQQQQDEKSGNGDNLTKHSGKSNTKSIA
jgi:hypothetical protein